MTSFPWAMLGWAYAGFALYLITAIANPADESLQSIADVFLLRGKTVLVGSISVLLAVVILQHMGELNTAAAIFGGYTNISVFKKASDAWMAKRP